MYGGTFIVGTAQSRDAADSAFKFVASHVEQILAAWGEKLVTPTENDMTTIFADVAARWNDEMPHRLIVQSKFDEAQKALQKNPAAFHHADSRVHLITINISSLVFSSTCHRDNM